MAKRAHTPSPVWGRAIRVLMASSSHLSTQTALAKISGVAPSTISRILRGEVDPQSDNLERLARAFGMPYSALSAIAESGDVISDSGEMHQPGTFTRRVPLLSLEQAGKLVESGCPNQLGAISDWIALPKKRQGSRIIALRVSGESMEPVYRHGDILYVDPDAPPIHGKDVIVRHGELNDVIFKRLVVESEGRYLRQLNPNWPDKVMTMPTDARIVGVVVGRYTDF